MPKASVQESGAAEELAALERRKSDRADLVVRVDYRTVDELFSDFARNINEGGIFVESDTPPPRGTVVSLHFKLPGGEEPVRTRGTVVHVSHGDGEEPSGMGIEFDDLDPPTRQRLNQLVRRLRAASPR
jgi:type IV pilus assembly protein PilZ